MVNRTCNERVEARSALILVVAARYSAANEPLDDDNNDGIEHHNISIAPNIPTLYRVWVYFMVTETGILAIRGWSLSTSHPKALFKERPQDHISYWHVTYQAARHAQARTSHCNRTFGGDAFQAHNTIPRYLAELVSNFESCRP